MSDDDLIRRGDARRVILAYASSYTSEQAETAIRALPAHGVGDYRLAPHLQKIVDGAKTAPQWDTQADRLVAIPATDAREKPRPYMGQIMAECDCVRTAECEAAEACLALVRSE